MKKITYILNLRSQVVLVQNRVSFYWCFISASKTIIFIIQVKIPVEKSLKPHLFLAQILLKASQWKTREYIVQEGYVRTYLPVGWDERDETDNTGISEQFGYFTDTTDVFFTIVGGESQILQEIIKVNENVQNF